jgi:hypothetical protein
MSFKNTGITHPVLVDVVSGEIKPIEWKQGTTDTLELLPVKDSIMAITDENYFDWPVLPEAPSSLRASASGKGTKIVWEVHGGDANAVVVERQIGTGGWTQLTKLAANATEFADTSIKKGQPAGYRVRAVSGNGSSAYSNVARTNAE